MPFLIVNGTVIPIAAPGGTKRDRSDNVDRGRRFDNSYAASVAGGAARDFHFSTPVISRVAADSIEPVLAAVGAQICLGDILALPTMCCSEITGYTPVPLSNGLHGVIIEFILHEVQSARVLLSYKPGDIITGESFSRSTTATYYDGNGALRTAAINTKRDNHFNTLADVPAAAGTRSLLLEDARTNLIIRAEELDNAAWTKVNAGAGSLPVVTANNGTAPDGNVTAEKVVFAAPGVGDQSFLTQSPAVVNATVYTGTIFVKAFAAGDVGKTLLYRQVGGSAYTPIVLSAIWQRLGSTETSTSTTGNFEIGLRPSLGGSSGTVSAFIWGAKLEPGSFASSYSPTTTVAVTRGADSYSLPFPYTPFEMTVYMKFVEGGTINIVAARLMEITSAAGASPRLILYNSGSAYRLYHDTVASVQFSTLAAAPVIGDTVELVGRVFGDGSVDIIQSINGAAPTAGAQSGVNGFAAAWAAQLVWLNSSGTVGQVGFTAIQSLKIVAGARSLAEMRAA